MTTENMAKLHLAVDAYISLFRAEGFNMPIAEAYYLGKPIITTKAPPVIEFLENTDNVFYVDAKPVHYKDSLCIHYFEPSLYDAVEAIIKASKMIRSGDRSNQSTHGLTWSKYCSRCFWLLSHLNCASLYIGCIT